MARLHENFGPARRGLKEADGKLILRADQFQTLSHRAGCAPYPGVATKDATE